MKASWVLALALAAIGGVGGCVSAPQRAAFEEFHQVQRSGRAASGPVHAGRPDLPVLAEGSPLSDYLAYAALNNPGLRAAFHRWKAELEKIPQARALPNPRFTYGYLIREIETRVGPQRQKFGISQMFPWFGKLRLRGDVAAKAAMAMQRRYEAARLKLFYGVKKAYAEYYYLSRAIAIAEENLALLKYLERVARTKYMAGAAGHPDVIKAQIGLGKLEDRLRTLRDLRGPLAAKLNASLGRSADQPVPWPSSLPEERIEVADEDLFAWLKEANPDLKALKFEIEKRQAVVKLAGKEYYPDVTLGIDYVDTAGARMGSVDDSGKDPVMAMVSVSLPVWRAKYRAAKREARARLRAAQNSLQDRQNTLESDVKLAIYGVRDADRKMDLYRDALLPKAKQSLKVTEAAYRAGKADFTDLLEAQRILLDFQLSYERALADQAQRLAELEMLVGREIPRVMPAAFGQGDTNSLKGGDVQRTGMP